MVEKAKIKVGDPIILIDSTGFEGQGLYDGMKGWANSVATVDQTYVFFMPQDGKEMYVTPASRVEVDEEAKAAGLELNENTIAKGD